MFNAILLREKYLNMSRCILEVNDYLQTISLKAYSNIYFICNEILSRNPHTNKFFHNVLFDIEPVPISFVRVGWGVCINYARGFYTFSLYVCSYILYRLKYFSRQNLTDIDLENLYIVDTFVYLNLLLDQQDYKESYFPELYEVLQHCGKNYIVLPRFVGRITPNKVLQAHTILQHSPHRFLTEFDLLQWIDLLFLWWQLCLYPVHILTWLQTFPVQSRMDKLFYVELLQTLSLSPFNGFVRYVLGKRIGWLNIKKLFLVSWCENQVVDKIFNHGLKETNPSAVIFGCQSLIAYPPYMCMKITDAEFKHHMAPDILLVNGQSYLDPSAPVPQQLGIAFRNKGVFTENIEWVSKKRITIFLSYFAQLNHEIIDLCLQSPVLRTTSLIIKAHPNLLNMKKAMPSIPHAWLYTLEDRFEIIRQVAVMITSETSVAVEAAALGTSIIIIASQSTFTCNPMLEGRGEIWELVFDSQELDLALYKLQEYRATHLERIQELADFYKTNCFVEPTEENIVKAFNL